MTLTRKNEILTKVSKLLDDLLEVDEINISERKEKAPVPMEMLTVKECTEAIKGLNEYTVANRMFALFDQNGARCAEFKGKQKALWLAMPFLMSEQDKANAARF